MRRISMLCLAVACMSGCGGAGTDPTTTGTGLTSAESALLIARVQQIAPVHPELAWLADSVSVALGAGTEPTPVDLSTDLATGPFYAVALHRAFVRSTTSLGTYDVIAFNDPSNPTDFIIVDGWSAASSPTPPASVSGTFGAATSSSAVTAHFFHISGNTVAAWRATTGGATLAADTVGAACTAFQATAGVTCAQASMKASFNVISAASDSSSSSSTRHATLSSSTVGGVLLTFDNSRG